MDRTMRWKVTIFGSLFLLALVTGVILSVWFIPEKNSAGFYFGVAACLLIVIALFITLLVEVPIDNQIRTWTPETVPANWTVLRARWEVFHTARTFISLAGLCSLILAVLSSK